MALVDLIALTKNSIILTPNERLSRRLHRVFAEQMQTQKSSVWPMPSIMSLSTWHQQLYQTAIEQQLIKEVLLSHAQYTEVWHQIIDKFLIEKKFLEPPQTVMEMMSAWQILKQWQVNYKDITFTNTEEAKLFDQCASYVDKTLRKNNWLALDEIADRLCQLPLKSLMPNVNKIILFGFDEITPQSQALFDHLKRCAFEMENIDWEIPAINTTVHVTPSLEQEYYAMANWAHTQLMNGMQQITCIVPDLTSSRDLIARIFNEVFYPNALFENYSASKHFNISGGNSLASLPMINIVFNFLDMYQYEFDYNTISNIILSPFITAAETEKLTRIQLDLKLRDKSLKTVYQRYLFLPTIEETCPAFGDVWKVILRYNPGSQYLPPTAWIQWLAGLLKHWGWPGERILNSQEYQQLQQWYAVMDELATLDDFCGQLNFNQFIYLLKQTVNNVKFQIKTTDAPVQILGMLEASGDLYDCIWIAGLTDKAWPPAVAPNPYIPFETQRRLNMPHASSQRQYDYSLKMMQRWLNSAPTIHFSYAEMAGDEPLACSPLLKPYVNKVEQTSSYEWSLPQQLHQVQKLETIAERPYVSYESDASITFSSSLFEQQVNCPFQAFAKQRLKSDEFKNPQQSWDRRLRGTNLHAVMEILWQRWQSSHALHQLSDDEIYEQVDATIESVLQKCFPSLLRPTKHDYYQLEKNRLLAIVLKWLQIEKTREPFLVHAIESKQQANIAGLVLNLKIDRIDKTETGHWILIDYKANTQNVNDWFKTPPHKPQMLLYASILDPKPDVITYASLHPTDHKMKFIGVAAEGIDFQGIKAFNTNKNIAATTWSDLLQDWQTQIYNIANEFTSGHLSIKPLAPDTCNSCHLASLCRINDK